MTEKGIERRLAAILAADVAGYSRLMGADEEGTLARLKAARREVVDPAIGANGGRIVKTTGDGLLVEFASAVAAARCAVEIQSGMARHGGPITFRIGVNLGDVMHEAGDVFGEGVNVAARLEQLAEPGRVVVSRAIFDQIRGRLALDSEDLGPQELKNIARPVRAYRIAAAAGYAAAPVARIRKRPHAAAVLVAALAALAIVGFGTGWLGLSPVPVTSTLAVPVAAPSLSVAVLPFRSLSADPQDEITADGITDDLITDLSRISGAFVISRSTSFAYKGTTRDVRELGRELGVRYVLEGSVCRTGEELRLNVQLSETDTGGDLWVDRFDIAAADLYRVQDEITGRIARSLNVELKEAVSRRAARGRPEDLDAVQLATQGWVTLFAKPQSPATNEEARLVLERAIALDPTNAEAWTGTAYLHTRAALYGWSPSRQTSLELAVAAGEKAVALDPRSADAQFVFGFALHTANQTERARLAFERSLELNPNYAPAYFWQAWIALFDGHPAEAPPLVEKAFKLSPRDGLAGVWYTAEAMAYLLLADDESAMRAARAGIAENPKHPQNYSVLAAALAHADEMDEAAAALHRAIELRPSQSTIAQIVATSARPSPELYAERFTRYLDGLRKAGMPEG